MAVGMAAQCEGEVAITNSVPHGEPPKVPSIAQQTTQPLKRDPDAFLNRPIQDLFSLAQRTVVITGGARGIGLAFAFAVGEAGGNVAVLDLSEDPHVHFLELIKRVPQQRFRTYK